MSQFNNSSLKTTFNGTDVKNYPKHTQLPSMRDIMEGRKKPKSNSLLDGLKGNYNKFKGYGDSYSNFGTAGLLGHLLNSRGEDESNFNLDIPNMKMEYNTPKTNYWLKGDKHGGARVGVNHEF